MPLMHKYKCLNSRCPGTGSKAYVGLFNALNKPTPSCPCCRSMKVEDWGEISPYEKAGPCTTKAATFGKGGAAKSIDGTLRRLATAYDMTDINNRDGKPAKGHEPDTKPGKYGNLNIAGVDCPVNDRPTGAWGKTPYTAFKTGKTGEKLAGREAAHRNVSQNTQVVAEHKG